MIKFYDQSLIMEALQHEGVFVIDSDLQGSWAVGEQRYFKECFPAAYEEYLKACITKGSMLLGTAMLVEDAGYKLAILFTKKHRKGIKRNEDVQVNFQNAVIDLFRQVPSDVWFYSPTLGVDDNCSSEFLLTLSRLTKPSPIDGYRLWHMYQQKGYGDAYNY